LLGNDSIPDAMFHIGLFKLNEMQSLLSGVPLCYSRDNHVSQKLQYNVIGAIRNVCKEHSKRD
jgi:hypothetical protein